ncbi:phosphatase PAP2 family protein [Dyadobacter psychrotolerans]|uniref:Phosphatase PAP2 family protein n=1 Tax=Dyadobacter psychrotolerans TaxID=2541721 RepID=A0A4R5DGR6_9BACT|nr:phosphatase PAP2 family protein [Dyadobacter psychrotolerans]TDE11034.1 phosphatase PAP2 family protein [Dyadobacter psychrotolerans]
MKKVPATLLVVVVLHFSAFSQNADSTRKELRFSFPQLYAPFALILAGFISNGHSRESIKNEIAEERKEHIPRFKTKLDDYLQFSPLAVAYGLDAAGVKSNTDFVNRSVILVKGEILAISTVMVLKKAFHIQRPDGSSYNSFPSGHTTQAFAAATFLSEEYKGTYRWMPYASYTVASSVGILRVANNRHYISDVLVGAGVGFLSIKVAYWTHQYKWGKRLNRKNSK